MHASIYSINRSPDQAVPNGLTDAQERARDDWIRFRTFEIQRDLAGISAHRHITVTARWADMGKPVVPLANDFIGWLASTHPDFEGVDFIALIFQRDQMPTIYREYAEARAAHEADSINWAEDL